MLSKVTDTGWTGKSSLDPAEIGDLVHRIAESGEQRKPVRAFVRFGSVDDYIVKEPIDRRA